MSHVLKDKSDVYNFTSSTPETAPVTKRRTKSRTKSASSHQQIDENESENNTKNHRLRSKTSSPVKKIKGSSKLRCDTFKEIISISQWLTSEVPPNDESETNRVIELLLKHINGNCTCTDTINTRLLLANTYYEMFLMRFRAFKDKIVKEEMKIMKDKESVDVSTPEASSLINDIPEKKMNRFDGDAFLNLIGFCQFSELISPLKNALNEWKETILNHGKDIGAEIINKLKVIQNLNATCSAFSLYDMPKYQLEASYAMIRYCRIIGTDHSDLQYMAIYNLLKSFISLGHVKEASRHLEKIHGPLGDDIPLPSTFGSSLMFLITCEINLLNGLVQKSAHVLKKFIESEYLQKFTTNRYFVKGLALMLASQYHGTDYQFASTFNEFLEPIQIGFGIMRRWYTKILSRDVETENTAAVNDPLPTLDPMWFQIAVTDFTLKSISLACHFYYNIGMVTDFSYYYNLSFKVARRTCSILCIAKLLILASQFDVLCDQNDNSIIRLENAIELLQTFNNQSPTKSEDSVFDSISEMDIARMESDNDLHQFDSDSMMVKCLSPFKVADEGSDDECGHKEHNLMKIREKLRNYPKSSCSFQDEDLYTFSFNINSIEQHFESEEFKESITEMPQLLLIKFEITNRKLLYCNTIKLRDKLKHLKQLYNNYSNFITKCFIPCLRSIFLNNKPKISIVDNELRANYSPMKRLELEIIKSISKVQIECGIYRDTFYLCRDPMLSTKMCNYYDRCIVYELKYLNVFCHFKLIHDEMKHIHSNRIMIEYSHENSQLKNIRRSKGDLNNTPPRLIQKANRSIPDAPKAKKEFKTQEIHDYYVALKDAAYKDHETKMSVSTSKKSHDQRIIGPKANRLVFDSVSRSVSISEDNLSIDTPLCNVIPKPLKNKSHANDESKVKPDPSFSRMTRTRSSSLMNAQKTLSEDEKSQKNPSQTLDSTIDISDDCFDDVIDELNNVFREKATIKGESNDLNLMISSLKTIIKKFGNHPPVLLYNSIHQLIAQIYALKRRNHGYESECGYHFAESITANTFRYRTIFISERKKRCNRSYKYNDQIDSFAFGNENESIAKFTKNMPQNWRIVQLLSIDNGTKIPDLIIVRYQRHRKPLFVKVKGTSERIIKHFMVQFNDILIKSDASIHNCDREIFWRLRYSLDDELSVLLDCVENVWFGAFMGIMIGEVMHEEYQNMCQRFKRKLLKIADKEKWICCNNDLLDAVIEAMPLMKHETIVDAMLFLFSGLTVESTPLWYSIYFDIFNPLLQRPMIEKLSNCFDNLGPVGLVLDKSLETFPFESLPFLKICSQPMFRIPSLRMLSIMLQTFCIDNEINNKSVYYILNPADNLPKTEDFFKNQFQSHDQWSGVIGKPPLPHELRDALEDKDIFLFFGHGAGSTYYRQIPDGLDSVNINPTSLVMGCSSGRLFADGEKLESYGPPLKFMMNGGPCYVGTLWDVTDKDIDRFSDSMLTHWMPLWDPIMDETKQMFNHTDSKHRIKLDIARAVCKSRDACKLSYLIGAAPIVYGIPFYVRNNTTMESKK